MRRPRLLHILKLTVMQHESFVNPVTINTVCPECNQIHTVTVELKDYINYRHGIQRHPQDAFPYLTPSQRELLITSICESCWNTLFPDNEEDE